VGRWKGANIRYVKERAIPRREYRIAPWRNDDRICNQLLDAETLVIPSDRCIPLKVGSRDAGVPNPGTRGRNLLIWDQRVKCCTANIQIISAGCFVRTLQPRNVSRR